jgi:hypothetical protein
MALRCTKKLLKRGAVESHFVTREGNERACSLAPVRRRTAPDGECLAACRDSGQSYILRSVSPTVLRVRGYRFYFFSREEPRAHVHVQHSTGEAKFWLEPRLELARNYGLTARRINTALKMIRDHEDEIRTAWRKHFGR